MADMIKMKKARESFAVLLATELPAATRAYVEALDAKCLRILRCERAPANETQNLDRLLNEAASNK
jgi:hypothetical protein